LFATNIWSYLNIWPSAQMSGMIQPSKPRTPPKPGTRQQFVKMCAISRSAIDIDYLLELLVVLFDQSPRLLSDVEALRSKLERDRKTSGLQWPPDNELVAMINPLLELKDLGKVYDGKQ
jgi:hypothetical protein